MPKVSVIIPVYNVEQYVEKSIQSVLNQSMKDIEIIFVTAFQTMKKCQQKFLSIAWDTEIWVAEEPTHMIHKNGNKFLDAHSNTISKNK